MSMWHEIRGTTSILGKIAITKDDLRMVLARPSNLGVLHTPPPSPEMEVSACIKSERVNVTSVIFFDTVWLSTGEVVAC